MKKEYHIGIISLASGSSCWRGLDYYKSKKVTKLNKIGEGEKMKRRFANQVEGDYYQDRIVSEYFTGYVCYIKLKNIEKPLIVNNGVETICIKDNNYEWLELYPDNGKYALTIMLDDKRKLIEWYFDIAQKIGIEDGIPYEDDLYLDMIISPEGKELIIDKDELQEAVNNGNITQIDVDEAYKTLEYLEEKYVKNFDKLMKFTQKLIDKYYI